jgi:uncharacterized protein (TIGR02145 family)
MTVRRHRIIQWIAITLILSAGSGWYYQVKVKGAETTISESPSFQADLKSTLDLQAGVEVPTFTRATTATVTDFEGLIKNVKSGEARFEGARRVENLIPTPSNSLTSGNNKTITVTAGTYVFSMGAGASSGVATFSGTSGANGKLVQHATKRISAPLYVEAGTIIITASVATLTDLQLEQVTGQSNQNPSEYVSVGVLTSAPYHGANVDGVKYFTTYNGNTTTTVAGSGIARGPTGATWSGADNAYYAYPPNTGNTAEETLANIQTNKLGFVYQWSAANSNIAPKGWHLPTDAEQNTLDQYLKDTGQTCNAARSNAWDCSSAGTKLKLGGTSGFNGPLAGYRNTTGGFLNRGTNGVFWSSSQSGGTAWYRALSTSTATVNRFAISKAYGFSVRCLKDDNNTDPATTINDVDGNSYGTVTIGTQTWLDANLMTSSYVQYEVTEATGASIPDATLHGYVAEGARTNLLLQSETLGTTWTPTTLTVTSNSAVAPSGATTAETLTATADNATLLQSITSASATRAFSIWLKRKTGTGNIDLTVDNGATWTTKTITSSWARYDIKQAAVTNPIIGLRIVASGDEVYAWGGQLESASFASSYIPTTTASVTRNGDVLTYPNTGNANNTVGSAYAEYISPLFGTTNNLSKIISTPANLVLATSNGAVNSIGFYDGTTALYSTDNLVANSLSKIASRWGGVVARVFAKGVGGTEGNFDGNMSFSNITIGGIAGTIRNVKLWKKALTDTQLINMTSTNANVAQSAVTKTTIVKDPTKHTTVNVNQNDKLTNGLVGFWSFNGKDISGTTAYDRSGQGNNGTLVGGLTVVGGKVGQALQFDGATGYVTTGTSYNGVKTISFWVKPNSTTQSLFDFNGIQTVDIAAGTIRANSFSTPTIYVDGTATATLSNTDWHFVTITTDTGINASAFTMGKIASAYFAGPLDEVRIYNRALSASEVNQLYMLGRGPWMCGNDTISDIDGNVYGTVLIGTQCWMNANLMTTRQPNGTAITRGPTGATWSGADNAYYAYPPNTGNTAEETLANIQTNKLGFVYQWSAAMAGSTTEGAQGICPVGWHLPTDAQQNTLDQYLTDTGQTCNASRNNAWDCSSAGTKLKLGGTSGFNGPLAGYRGTSGGFLNRGTFGLFWSSSQSGGTAWNRDLDTSLTTVYRNAGSKAYGFSVRCLKD